MMIMGPVLAMDTSTPTARVAVLDASGRTLASGERTALRASSVLLALCDEMLSNAGLRIADVFGIACGAGPGSFTGLRVGLAVAKGLALPTGARLVLVSSLASLARDLDAQAAAQIKWVVPCLDAGKGQVYAQRYRRAPSGLDAPDGPEETLDPGVLARRLLDVGESFVLGGSGADRHAAALAACLPPNSMIVAAPGPSAAATGYLGLQRLRRGESDDLASAVPSYGRPPDITTPKRT